MHNREFIGVLPEKYCDWMLTGAFYAAVHAVEALFAFDGQPNQTSHESRNLVLKSVRRYQQIWKKYRELYNGSQTTRYHCSPGEWIPAEQIKSVWIPQYLYAIEKSIQKLMADTEPLPPVTWNKPAQMTSQSTGGSSIPAQ